MRTKKPKQAAIKIHWRKDNGYGVTIRRWRRVSRALHIRVVSLSTSAPRAPYALAATAFPLPALAALAGRAPLGGPREIAMATFLVSRLAIDACSGLLAVEQLAGRAQAARAWLAAASIPVPIRTALTALAEATSSPENRGLAVALESVTAVTANYLDSAARLELGRLAQAVAA